MKILQGVPVFGDPIDEKALAQILSASRNAVAAALMADHHVGYGVPIGGVVAYRDAVSPSGVGYDIACFTGETKVPLLDGTQVSMAELHSRREPFWVYSIDETGHIVPGKARCLKTRSQAGLVRVTVSGGDLIECTPDHEFLLRDGTYCAASKLRRRQSLMPFYRSYETRDGYERINHPEGNATQTHKMVDRFFNGPLTVGLHIHHRDGNWFNNAPENLERMTKEEHDAHHASTRGRHFRTEEFKAHRLRVLGEKGFFAPELLSKKQAVARSNGRSMTSDAARRAGNGQRGTPFLIAYNQSEKGRAKSREIGRTYGFGRNHKVISVAQANRKADVYCLQVERWHNFALSAGVFVHNCGNKAVRTDARASELQPGDVEHLMDDIWRTISFGVGRKNDEPVDHVLFDDPAWQDLGWLTAERGRNGQTMRDKAAAQLGTVGSGNHYVDLFRDEEGWLWIGVHFGSRGFGHGIATHYLEAGGASKSMDAEPLVLSTLAGLGQEYLEGMRLAGLYAYAGRDWVCARVAKILGAAVVEEIHNHHNFAWAESHVIDGHRQDLWVVRKGATPAFPEQKGFVGGSMGDNAVIIEGRDVTDEFASLGSSYELSDRLQWEEASREQTASLFSTVHGAGRVMSRTAATGRNRRGKQVHKPLVDRDEMQRWIAEKGVVLRGAGLDEAPQVYKRLPGVLAEHAATIRVLHELQPIGVAMAGADEHDPYRD